MRYLTLNLNPNTRIDIDNSIWGRETIRYNNEVVSEKTSIFGSVHSFEKKENGELAKYEICIGLNLFKGVTFDIFRNNQAILLN
jgi:hypothetical protein